MKKLEKIKEHLLTIIQKEEIKTQSEIEELSQKQRDNMDFYGIGGPYQRYEQAIDRRKKHLSELEALRKAQNSAILLESLRLYGYFCPSCKEKIYLQERNPETVDCPICSRMIYKDGVYTEWNVQKTAGLPACTDRETKRIGGIIRWHFTKSWICGPYQMGWIK